MIFFAPNLCKPLTVLHMWASCIPLHARISSVPNPRSLELSVIMEELHWRVITYNSEGSLLREPTTPKESQKKTVTPKFWVRLIMYAYKLILLRNDGPSV